VVDVEEDALCALEQDAAAALAGFVEVDPDRAGEGEDEVGDTGEIGLQRVAVDGRVAEAGAQARHGGRRGGRAGVELVQMARSQTRWRGGRPCPRTPGRCRGGWCRSCRRRSRLRAGRRGRGGWEDERQVSAMRRTSGSTRTPWPRKALDFVASAQGRGHAVAMIDRVPVTMPAGEKGELGRPFRRRRACGRHLWPPWKRTTQSARLASQSTILPLPSSPHWRR
jgi:hypothetical protein